MIARESIIAEARTWIGTPWRHQASLKGIGADCIGLLAGVANNVGITEAAEFLASHECRAYGRHPDAEKLLEGCDRWLDMIKVVDAGPADVFVMKFEIDPQHFALISEEDPPYMIHAYAQARKTVENRIDHVWRSRIVRAYRFRGVAPWQA